MIKLLLMLFNIFASKNSIYQKDQICRVDVQQM